MAVLYYSEQKQVQSPMLEVLYGFILLALLQEEGIPLNRLCTHRYKEANPGKTFSLLSAVVGLSLVTCRRTNRSVTSQGSPLGEHASFGSPQTPGRDCL